MKRRYTPNPDTLQVTPGASGDPHDPDGMQILSPAHFGAAEIGERNRGGQLRIASAECKGCGERQTEIMIVAPDGLALYVKLRPSMAIKLGELCMIHGKAGKDSQ